METKAHIEKLPNGKYRLVSKKTGKNLGTYDTLEEAKKREREVEYFKHKAMVGNPLALNYYTNNQGFANETLFI